MASVAASGHHAQAGNQCEGGSGRVGSTSLRKSGLAKNGGFRVFNLPNPRLFRTPLSNREQVTLKRWHMDDEPHTQRLIFCASSQHG